MFFDTHAHLDADEFDKALNDLLPAWRNDGLADVLAVATSLQSSRRCIEIAGQFPEVWASAGIHPNYCHEAADNDLAAIRPMLDHPRVVAIGETGLDKYWDFAPFDRQIEFFTAQIRLSHESGLPFIVHSRDCDAEMLQHLRAMTVDGRLNGVMHSFCGSAEMAEQCLGWGMMISFSGMLTYPRNDGLRETAARIPRERLMVETDAPWLSPHPHRGVKPNTPAMVRHTIGVLAECHGCSPKEMTDLTRENALRFFNVKDRQSPE